jgi:hypothetical protein
MEKVGDRQDKMEGHCSTGQSPQRAVAPMEEEENWERVITLLEVINVFAQVIEYPPHPAHIP